VLLKKGLHNGTASILLGSLLLSLLLPACSRPAPISKLVVFAAGGTRPAIDAIGQGFEGQYRIPVETNYGGGGEALSKMMLAKRGDIYVAPAPEQRFMETAQAKKAIDPATIQTVAYLVPVIAVTQGNPKGVRSLLRPRR
jgi:ABC-type molybdate transport system substrate-binding protein